MKTQMKARPVYHRTDKAIKAHFSTCFVALFIYRVLEHRLSSEYTTDQILDTLKDMNALHTPSEGFIPTFKRTELTDKLFEISGFRIDTEIIMLKRLKSIIAQTKNWIYYKVWKSKNAVSDWCLQRYRHFAYYKVSKMGNLLYSFFYAKYFCRIFYHTFISQLTSLLELSIYHPHHRQNILVRYLFSWYLFV